MAADFKSHVLLRDEKGFLGLPFKRLLLAGVIGGLTYSVGRFAAPDAAIPLGLGLGLALLVMTGTRGGLPLWQRLRYRLRGALALWAAQHPDRLLFRLADPLDLPVGQMRLDGARLFGAAEGEPLLELREWVAFARPDEADQEDGLYFMPRALGERP